MLPTFLKIALRNYRKNQLYALLNLLGLVTAYLTLFVIAEYLFVETRYEHFHPKADRIYRITHRNTVPNGDQTHWARTYLDFVNELPNEMPEVEHLIRFQNHQRRFLRIGENKFRPTYSYTTDPEVFEVFGFNLIEGDPKRALAEPYSIVLTASLAKTYFGDADPIGKEIGVIGEYTDEEITYTVRGIMADPPAHSHMPVDLFFSFKSPEERSWWAYVYILLKEGTHAEQVEAKMPAFLAKHSPENQGVKTELALQPIKDIHLTSALVREIVPNGDMLYVRAFSWIGILVLLIAMVNSLNLSAALALGRGQEIGMHRVLGASKGQLFRYSLLEIVLYHLFAASLGLLAGYFLLPLMSEWLTFEPLLSWPLAIAGILGTALVGGLLSGVYPAGVLARAKTQQVFRQQSSGNNTPHRQALIIRRLLVGLQLGAAFFLLASAWTAGRQMRFLQDKDLGMSVSQVVAIPRLPNPVTDKYMAFRERVSKIPGVAHMAACMEVPSREIRDMGPTLIMGQNQDPEKAPLMDVQVISPGFLETMDIKLLAGEDQSHRYKFGPPPPISETFTAADYLGEQSRTYLINETAMRKLGWKTPQEAIGQQISWSIGNFKLAYGPVTGVVQDVHQETLRNLVDPTVMVVEQIWLRTFLMRINTQEVDQTLADIEAVWNELFPTYVMEVEFLDELYARLYQQDKQQMALLWVLSGLAIFIALLGLFSLLAYTLQVKMKEIAIRRIVGASWNNLTWLLSKDYLILLGVMACIMAPVSYQLMGEWLAEFAYKVDILPFNYGLILGGFGLLIVLTVAFQLGRNARRSADVLREG